MCETEHVSPAIIAAKNEELRKMLPLPLPFPHSVVLTDEIAALPEEKISQILGLVRDFEVFEDETYGERDFGTFDFEGQRIIWKFDYVDEEEQKYFVENGIRILIIMFAHVYSIRAIVL